MVDDEELQSESLKLYRTMEAIQGYPWPPRLDSPEYTLFRQLKNALRIGDLVGGYVWHSPKDSAVTLDELRKFSRAAARKANPTFQPVRDFCDRWESAQTWRQPTPDRTARPRTPDTEGRAWYARYCKRMQANNLHPTREHDIEAAKAAGISAAGDTVETWRRDLAPDDWKAHGRRKAPRNRPTPEQIKKLAKP